MADLSVETIDRNGLSPTFASLNSGGDTFANSGDRVFFVAKNGDTSSHTVTVNSKEQCDQGFDHDVSVTVPAGEERWIGPFPRARFGDPVELSYDAVTSMTGRPVKLST